jgi:hypothetical protein
MSKHCFHYGFARWLRLRKLASFAENVRDDCTPEPSPSPVRRIAGITISSPHTPRTKARRSKPHRALITVLKDALLCMSRASFASKFVPQNFVPRCQLVAVQSCNILPQNICGLRSPSRQRPARNLVLRSARHPEARVPHLGRAPRRVARVSKDGHKRDRASGHPSRRAHAGMRPPQDEAFGTCDAAAAARSGKAPASAARFGATMPRSVIRPVTSRAGVTSNA